MTESGRTIELAGATPPALAERQIVMGQKTTKTPAAPAAAAPANPAKAEAERIAQNDKFVWLGKVVEGAKKLAPQAQNIVNLIQAAGKSGITRVDLVAKMNGVVQTRQPLGRILSYYQKEIQEKGYVTVEKAVADAKAA